MHRIPTCIVLGATLALLLPGAVSAHGTEAHAHAASGDLGYAARSSGTRTLTLGPVSIKVLAEAANLGRGDVEVGELILPVESGESVPHQHGSLELFYVVEGVLGHEVNGMANRLEPGDLGIVRPGDTVKHAVLSDVPVKAVVIWVPGGEADRLVEHAGFAVTPLGGTGAD